MRIGVVGHRGYTGLTDLLRLLAREAAALGLECSFEADLVEELGEGQPLRPPAELDLLVTMGGDGTLLRGARFLDGAPAPIFGVNLGRLGFLTSCSAEAFAGALPALAAGRFIAEDRMALEARALGSEGGTLTALRALNDVVLHKGGFARVMRVRVCVDDEEIGVLAADGIVVSTPTGSTAYSLSAGGPIVVPTVETILVTPIAAHTLAMRPFVLPPDAVLRMQPEDGAGEVLVTADGQVGTNLGAQNQLEIRRASRPVRIARLEGFTFFSRLRAKMGWGGPA